MPLSVLHYFCILFSAPLRPRDLAIRNVIRRNDSVSVTLRWTDLLNFTTQTDARNTYNFSVEFSRLPTLMFVSDDQIPHRGEVIVDGVSLHQYIFDLLNFIFFFILYILFLIFWCDSILILLIMYWGSRFYYTGSGFIWNLKLCPTFWAVWLLVNNELKKICPSFGCVTLKLLL